MQRATLASLLFSVLLIGGAVALPHATTAQSALFESSGLDAAIEEGTGLGNEQAEDIVISAINWVLSILALIAVILIIFAGVTWMTAAGDETKVDKAKDILRAAVIGLAITMAAWGITLFVTTVLTNVTTASS